MLPDDTPGGVHDHTGLRRGLLPDELTVVAAGDEADLLAVHLVGEVESCFSRQRADLVLGESPHWQKDAAQLLLSESEQHIGLVLPCIHALTERPQPAGTVALDAGVVARGDEIGVHHRSALHEEVELDAVVAGDTGVGGASALVLAHEVGDDVLAELAPCIHDVVRRPDRLADAARVLYVLDGAAALMVRRYVILVRRPEAHRHTDDVVPLPAQQVRGNRRVDAARHRGDDPLLVLPCPVVRFHALFASPSPLPMIAARHLAARLGPDGSPCQARQPSCWLIGATGEPDAFVSCIPLPLPLAQF